MFDIGTSTATVANRNGGITVNFGGLNGGSGTFLQGRQAGSGNTSSTYSPQTVLPAGYVNNGTILTNSLVAAQAISKSGNSFSVTIHTYTGHTYQLEKSSNLSTWQNVGASQAGTGSAVVLSDTNASSSGMLYKIGVGP